MQFPTCEKGGSKLKKKESKHPKGRLAHTMKNGFNIVRNPKDRMQGEDHMNDGEDLSSVYLLTFEVQPNLFSVCSCGL
jgi:hypothetical protein